MTDYTMNVELLRTMMDGITALRDTRAVKQKGGKMYTMVQDRIETLRRHSGDFYRIQTEIIQWGGDAGAMLVIRATIRDLEGSIIATGHAEEVRGSNYINEASALENCETSAIGRALAVLGLHGGEFASADEIDLANKKRDKIETLKKPEPKLAVVEAAPKKPVPEEELKVVDLEEMIEKSGGPTRKSFADHPVLVNLKPEVIGLVESMLVNTPVLKSASKDHDMLEECFFTFLPLCTTVDEAYSFWHANEHLIKALKKDAPEHFARVRDAFATTKTNLQKKAKS